MSKLQAKIKSTIDIFGLFERMNEHALYMGRAIELAKLGAGNTGSNPMVGAVLVHQGLIIGEGYHRKYGEAHAEVNCLQAVRENDLGLIPHSTLYVSLEPCSHFGKTPPCADLVISKGIKKVIIGSRDPFPDVDGKGIAKLKAAGIDVSVGILEKECLELNKRFFTFHTRQRPYIILKWAQTADHFVSAGSNDRLMISNDYTNRLVHKWRSEEMSIMVGANTAKEDNPSLTTRFWSGQNPVRIVTDTNLKLPAGLNLYNDEAPLIVFNRIKAEQRGNQRFEKIDEPGETEPATINLKNILKRLYTLQINSVLVEGGKKLLQSFIDQGYWDEARVITNTKLMVHRGIAAPVLISGNIEKTRQIGDDLIACFRNPSPSV